MAIIFVFLLGVGNFALQKAVLEAGHPALHRMPRLVREHGGAVMFATEFLILTAALLLVANGSPAMAWAYLAYSALSAAAAWLIVTRRI